MCDTCIYRPETDFDVPELERQIADPHLAGHFRGCRACHHARGRTVCCRGFWDRHKDSFDGGQIAQRLRRVLMVRVDYQRTKPVGVPRSRRRHTVITK